MTGLTRVTPEASLDEVVEIIERDGGLIVEDFVDAGTLEALWTDLGPALDAQGYGEDWYNGTSTRRVSSVFARTTNLTPVVTQPQYLGAARRLMQVPVPMWIGK